MEKSEIKTYKDIPQVEKVLAHKYKEGVCLFKVRWQGYSANHDTWEPHESFVSPTPVIEYYSSVRRTIPNRTTKAMSIGDQAWWTSTT